LLGEGVGVGLVLRDGLGAGLLLVGLAVGLVLVGLDEDGLDVGETEL
jgi:hypothetical protein